MLPENVTPPIITERNTVAAVNAETAASAPPASPTTPGKSAAAPTSKLAMPPEPLNNATISGIAVMATSRAANAPTTAPAPAAMAIQCQDTTPLESKVATTATSMPAADSALPRRAVRGEPSILSPNTNNTAAPR